MIVEGHFPGAAEGFLMWVDAECDHYPDPIESCPSCFRAVFNPAIEDYLDKHPECRPGSVAQ